jgi:hypothetical protein
MKIFEIDLGERVFISSDEEISIPVETELLEPNEWGMLKFLKNKSFYEFKDDGPEKISKKKIKKIFSKYSKKQTSLKKLKKKNIVKLCPICNGENDPVEKCWKCDGHSWILNWEAIDSGD